MISDKYLSTTEEDLLIRHVAAHGERYRDFVDWCDEKEIPPHRRFTMLSYRKWVQRHRQTIKDLREKARQETLKTSKFHRASRLKELEDTMVRIGALLDGTLEGKLPLTVSDIVRLEEQRRKTLEHIAKERGEWLKPPEEDTGGDEYGDPVAREFLKFFEEERRRVESAKDVSPGTFALPPGEKDLRPA